MGGGELKLRPVLDQNRPVSELRQSNTDSYEPDENKLNLYLNLDENVKATRAKLCQTQNPNEEGNTYDHDITRGDELSQIQAEGGIRINEDKMKDKMKSMNEDPKETNENEGHEIMNDDKEDTNENVNKKKNDVKKDTIENVIEKENDEEKENNKNENEK